MYRERAKGWLKHVDFIVLDIVCLQVAFALAYVARHGWRDPYRVPLYRGMAFALLMIGVAVIFFANVYSGVLKRGWFREGTKTLYETGLIVGLSTLYLFAIQEGEGYSRTVLFLTGIFFFFLSYGTRQTWKLMMRKVRIKTGNDAMLVATTADRIDEVIGRLREDPRRGFHISGIAVLDGGVHENVKELYQERYQDVPVVAVEKTLIEYVCREWVDELLLVVPSVEQYKGMIEQIVESGVAVHEYLGQAESQIGRKQVVESIGGYTVMTTSTNYVTFQQAFFKRAMDIVGGLIGSVLAVLAILIVGPIIYVQSPGPVLFKQVRVGRNGRRFTFLKIRSMVLNADELKQDLMEENRVKDGMMFKLDFDPRIIGAKKLPDGTVRRGIGNFIRDWSIDELPQFFNVLKGDMSLVGTRPPTMDEWEKYKLHHRARLAFKPGITGLWQVSGRSNITDFEEVVKLDTRYIREWDFGLDFRIMADTIKAVLERSGSM